MPVSVPQMTPLLMLVCGADLQPVQDVDSAQAVGNSEVFVYVGGDAQGLSFGIGYVVVTRSTIYDAYVAGRQCECQEGLAAIDV
jgi:hypothetical protein